MIKCQLAIGGMQKRTSAQFKPPKLEMLSSWQDFCHNISRLLRLQAAAAGLTTLESSK